PPFWTRAPGLPTTGCGNGCADTTNELDTTIAAPAAAAIATIRVDRRTFTWVRETNHLGDTANLQAKGFGCLHFA
ncbi:MAG: hypothetical protein ACRDQ2_02385, partial [Gaiellales bacterium]